MVRYGRTLLQHEPEATTELLIDLCSGNLGKKKAEHEVDGKTDGTTAGSGANGSGPAMLSYLGYNKVTGFLSGDTPSGATLNEDEKPTDAHDGTDAARVGEDEKEDMTPSYVPASPRQYFAHFVDHRELFIHFLESVALNLWNQKVDPSISNSSTTSAPKRDMDAPPPTDPTVIDQTAVWNTLLELYLSSSAEQSKRKALALINSDSTPYDPMHALVLCSSVGFREGMVRLWEGMGMYEDVLRYYMDEGQEAEDAQGITPSSKVFTHLEMYGPSHPHLYPLVLRYLTSSPAILTRHKGELSKILAKIDEYQIMPPLGVVQLLSRNGVVDVGSVKEWLRGKVEENEEEIESVSGITGFHISTTEYSQRLQDKHLYDSYRSETAAKRKAILDRSSVSQPEVFQVTKCAACGGQLDLPSVHFMCKHSYHQRFVFSIVAHWTIS